MDEAQVHNSIVEPPRGAYPARIDDKGRIKLPVPFQEYVNSYPEKKLFVTTMDLATAQIYPISIWRRNEELFDRFEEDPEAAQAIAFIANEYGADSEMDSQGRVLLPPELRRELGIENQAVRLLCYNGRIDIYSEAAYEERKKKAIEVLPEKLPLMRRRGLK